MTLLKALFAVLLFAVLARSGYAYTPTNALNNTQLQGMATITFPGGVTRNTFGNNNGAPPLLYMPSNAACSLNAGVGDNGSQVKSADGKCWLAAFPGEGADVRQFGADPSNATDSQSALQAWGNWITAGTGRSGWLAAGTYKILSPLVFTGGSNWSMLGAGSSAARIIYAGASTTNDILTISNTIKTVLQGWQVDSTTTMTAGAGIHLSNVNYSKVIDVTAGEAGALNAPTAPPYPKLWNGIFFDATNWMSLNFSNPYALNDGIIANHTVELNIDNTYVLVDGNSGVHITGGAGGVYLGHVSVECAIANNPPPTQGQHGLIIDTSLSALPNLQIFVSSSALFDSCNQDNVLINDAIAQAAGIRTLQWGGWSSAAIQPANNGIHIVNWNNGQLIVAGSSQILANQRSGIKIDDATVRLSIDLGASINGNAGYGVECVNTMHVIASGDNIGAWTNNLLGNFSSGCQAWLSFTPTATCQSSGTPPSLSASQSFYQRTGQSTLIQYDVTYGSTGTCDVIQLSAPDTIIGTCALAGREWISGNAATGIAAGSTFNVHKYDGTNLQTSGDRVFLTGTCFTQ